MAAFRGRRLALRLRSGLAALTLVVVAVCLPIAARALAGPRGAEIHVRWQASLDDTARRTLEARLSLADGERLEGTTWRYDLINAGTENIRVVVTDPNAADTHDLDRSTYSLSPTAARTDRRSRFGNAGRAMVVIADRLALGLL